LNFERINAKTDSMAGAGLANPRDRAEICEGRLEIISKPKAGTSIQLTLPLS